LALSPIASPSSVPGHWHHIRMCPHEGYGRAVRVMSHKINATGGADVVREIAVQCLLPDSTVETISTNSVKEAIFLISMLI